MADDYLYNELFNPSPRIEKKDSNSDLLNNLFTIPIKKSHHVEQKKKKQQPVHQYVRLAEKGSEKVKKSVQRMKEEQTMTPEQIRQKRQFQKITTKFNNTKAEVAIPGVKKVYMPTVVDPFSKPSKDKDMPKNINDTKLSNIKPSQNKNVKEKQKTKETEKVVPKEKDNQNFKQKIQDKPKPLNPDEKQKKSKLVAKQEKIQRKERQKERQKPREKAKDKDKQKLNKDQTQHKRKRQSSSSSSSSSSSKSDPQEQEQSQWRIQLRKITGKNFKDKKYRQRDQMVIKQSGIDRVFDEQKFSMRMGRLEEEEDLRRQERIKRLKDKHRHH